MLSQGRTTMVSKSAILPIRDRRRLQVMSDMFDDDPGDSSGGSFDRSGKHCNACNNLQQVARLVGHPLSQLRQRALVIRSVF